MLSGGLKTFNRHVINETSRMNTWIRNDLMDRFTLSVLIVCCILTLALYFIENDNKLNAVHITNTQNVATQIPETITHNKNTTSDHTNTSFQNNPADLPDTEIDYSNVEYTQISPEMISNLAVGEAVEFLIPQESRTYSGVIETINEVADGKSHIASGYLTQYYDSAKPATFSIIREDQQTFATIRTGVSTFQISINNNTGEATVTDQQNPDQPEHGSSDQQNDVMPPERINPSPLGSRESIFDS